MQKRYDRIVHIADLSKLFSGIAAFSGVCGIVFYTKIGANTGIYQNNFCNNILYIIALYPLYIGWKNLLNNICFRRLIFSTIGGLLFSTLLIVGAQLDYFSTIDWTISSFIKIILLASVFCLGIYHLFDFLKNRHAIGTRETHSVSGKRIIVLVTYGVIFCTWAIVYMALFPGVYGYDAPNQILQGLGRIQVSVYQPILHTFILGKCVEIGHILFGSYEAGLGIYSFIQLVFMACVASKVCMFIYFNTKRIFSWLISVLFFTVFPLHSVFAVSTTKDIIFTGIFALLFLKLFDIIEEPDCFWHSPKKMVSYGFLVFVLAWFRSNGIHIIAFMLIFLLILMRKFWKQILVATLIPIIAFLSIQNALIIFGNIGEGHTLREMLSIPCQQFARVYTYNQESLTEEEKETLFEIIPEDAFEVYPIRSMISDNIKGALDTEQLMKEPLKYMSLYIDIGLKNPKNYIEAAMLNCLAIWYPNKYYQDERQYHPYIEIDMIDAKSYSEDYLEFNRYSFIPSLDRFLTEFFQEVQWERLPVVSCFFTAGTYVWLILLFILYSIYMKAYRYLIPISFLGGLVITIVLGPVSLIRYAYPISFTIPIVIMQFGKITSNTKERKNIWKE